MKRFLCSQFLGLAYILWQQVSPCICHWIWEHKSICILWFYNCLGDLPASRLPFQLNTQILGCGKPFVTFFWIQCFLVLIRGLLEHVDQYVIDIASRGLCLVSQSFLSRTKWVSGLGSFRHSRLLAWSRRLHTSWNRRWGNGWVQVGLLLRLLCSLPQCRLAWGKWPWRRLCYEWTFFHSLLIYYHKET